MKIVGPGHHRNEALFFAPPVIGEFLDCSVNSIIERRKVRAVGLAIAIVIDAVFKVVICFAADPVTLAAGLILQALGYAFIYTYFLASAISLDRRGSWSGRMTSTYLVGSCLAPVIGVWTFESAGSAGLAIFYIVVNALILVPMWIVGGKSQKMDLARGTDTSRAIIGAAT